MPRRSSPDRSREGAVGSKETIMLDSNQALVPRLDPWNKGRLIGQKRPLKPKDVWSIRVRLRVERRARNLALFNLAIDSKLRGCDLVRLQVDDVSVGGRKLRVPYLRRRRILDATHDRDRRRVATLAEVDANEVLRRCNPATRCPTVIFHQPSVTNPVTRR